MCWWIPKDTQTHTSPMHTPAERLGSVRQLLPESSPTRFIGQDPLGLTAPPHGVYQPAPQGHIRARQGIDVYPVLPVWVRTEHPYVVLLQPAGASARNRRP